MNIAQISLDDIIIFKNVRKEFDPNSEDINELAKSMQENGQKIEIRVYPSGNGKYILLAGHRRMAAARINGWSDIRAVIENPPENEIELITGQYNENEQRNNLSYLDKARVYERLKELGMSQHEIAAKFGKSDTEISLALAALRADPKLQKAIDDEEIKPSAVEPLLSQDLDTQAELADAAIKAKTVRKISSLVRAHKQKKAMSDVEVDEATEIPDDADPLELISLAELQEALEHAKSAAETPITHPDLIREARPTVEQLVKMAAVLKQYIDGTTWEDTADLV